MNYEEIVQPLLEKAVELDLQIEVKINKLSNGSIDVFVFSHRYCYGKYFKLNDLIDLDTVNKEIISRAINEDLNRKLTVLKQQGYSNKEIQEKVKSLLEDKNYEYK